MHFFGGGKMEETIAWGDESTKSSKSGMQAYHICACICKLPEIVVRNKLLNATKKHVNKLHWRDMTMREKEKSIRIIEDLDLQHIIVSMPRNYLNLKPERARRKCMETLLETLESQYKVNLLILESREKHQNAKDLVLQKYLIKNKTIQKLQIEFKNGKDDARLWIPDQILGFYGEQLNKCEDPISVNLIQKFKNVHVKNI